MHSPAKNTSAFARANTADSGDEQSWLGLPADHGRCNGQPARLRIEAVLDLSSTGVSQDQAARVGLASMLVLLHRHTNQTSVAIGVCEGSASLSVAAFDFDDATRFSQVLRACDDTRLAQPRQKLPSLFVRVDTHVCVETSGLALHWLQEGERVTLRMDFDGRQYRSEHIKEFLAQFELLVTQALEDDDRWVLDYSLVTASGRPLLPDPAQPIEVPRYPLLSEAFATIADARPDDVAIRQSGRSWNYAEVDRTSGNIARTLVHMGVVPGDVVAVTGPRCVGTVCSVLGVFRSGATLLTIDPKLPLDRQRVMINQAKAKFLVRIGESSVLDDSGLPIVAVDTVGGASDFSNVALPQLVPAAAAYIFFTSGSTGVPKGVVGCHQGLAHFLDWQRKTFGIGPGDRAAQITMLSFDVVLRDMFLALTSGATLSIPEEAEVLDPAAILAWMASERISVLHLVPSLLRPWINNSPPGLTLPSLRHVFLAGEPLTDALIRSFRATWGSSALVTNFYGPTETTLAKCYHPVIEPEPGVQPVGRPQPQTQILILNRARKLCGVHEIGEIAIRTPFRTLGYLDAPEATAKAFVQNPFSDLPNDLVYLSGDSGCYRDDGLLVMLGRMDNQVKIRGVRVEPGEVEAALAHCPGIKEAAVVAHEGSQGKYLAAYLVMGQQATSAPTAVVRDFLRARLPENMVPTAYVVLDALPLLPNGKVNKKALLPQATTVESVAPADQRDAPRNALERELLEVWQGVLGHQRLSVHDSFVELGGNSLTAIAALVRMQRLGIPTSHARGIFQGWSIRQIAQMAEGQHSGGARTMSPKARTNLLVNVLRGILVAIVVAGHWFEGLLNRLPERWHGAMEMLMPLFNVATPGFALMFGLSLGYIYLPRYRTEPAAVSRAMRQGMMLVLAGVLVRAAFDIVQLMSDGLELTTTAFFMTFYSALLYYAIALATAPAWFRLMTRGTHVYRAIFAMALGMYVLYRGAQWPFMEQQREGIVELLRLMVMSKFNYFNMSAGALFGVAGGYYLHLWSQYKYPLIELSPRLAVLGTVTTLCGLLLLYTSTGSFAQIYDAAIMPVWKWIFYAGTVLLMASLLSVALNTYESSPPPLRKGFNLLGVFGQISLPVFVFHQLVLRVKSLLVHMGLPDSIALIIPLVLFFGGCGWMMHRLYGLYYGSVGASADPARTVSATT